MRNISLQKTSVLAGVFFCWLLFFLMCSEAKAQSNWTNAGGAMQQKVVAGDTSIRFTKLSSYGQPFNVTDDLKKRVDTFSNQNIRGKKIFINNVSLIDTSSIDTIPVNNAQLSLSRFYSNEPIRFYNQYDATVGRPQIFATGLLDGDYEGAAGDVTAGWLKWNTSGTKGNINGLMLQLAPGYTGTGTTRVIDAQNYIGGASTFNAYDMSANVGVAAESQGLSTGDNVGVYGIAGFAKGRNISGFFRATQDASTYQSKNKVGVFGIAGRLELDSGYNIGGVFSLQQWQDVSNILNTNAALIANNGDMPHPIFLGKVSGEDVFKIKRYGDVSIKSIGTSDVALQVRADSLNTNDIIKYYKGNIKYGSFSRYGDLAMRGRLLFYDDGDTTVTVQAVYVNGSDGRTVVRAGARGNKVSILNAIASPFIDFDGATSSIKVGSTVQNLTVPTDGARIGGALVLGTASDTGEKLQVDGSVKVTGDIKATLPNYSTGSVKPVGYNSTSDRMETIPSPIVVGSAVMKGKTDMGSIISYTVPADGYYKLEGTVYASAMATNTFRYKMSWTNASGQSVVITGSTISAVVTPPAQGVLINGLIFAAAGTTIDLITENVATGGTQTYDIVAKLISYN